MVNLFSFGCHVIDRAYVRTYVRVYGLGRGDYQKEGGGGGGGVSQACLAKSTSFTLDIHNMVKRQYSYSPTVLGRVGLDHEWEAHAGNFSPRGQTNMRKLRLSLPNLRNTFNIVKFPRAYTLERNH